VQHLHPISEDEMVAIFLKTEIASSRFGRAILAILNRDGQERQIIDQPDLANPAANAYRRQLLGEWRGYQRNAHVFKDFPADVRWYRGLATLAELEQLRYINDDYWIELSSGSRLAMDAIARIRHSIEAFEVSNAGFWYMADTLVSNYLFHRILMPIVHRDIFHHRDVLFRCFRVSQRLSLAKQGILRCLIALTS
jgi:hypothetical protein